MAHVYIKLNNLDRNNSVLYKFMKAERMFTVNLTWLKIRLSFLLTGLLLFSALTIGSHHHSDNAPHDDCSICIASAHSPAVSSSAGNLSAYTIAVFLEVSEKIFYLPIRAEIIYGSRAPPFNPQANHKL